MHATEHDPWCHAGRSDASQRRLVLQSETQHPDQSVIKMCTSNKVLEKQLKDLGIGSSQVAVDHRCRLNSPRQQTIQSSGCKEQMHCPAADLSEPRIIDA